MPYPGLRPFEAEDEPLFFGREAQVSAMLRQLEDHRFVAVVGSSGWRKILARSRGPVTVIHEGFLLGTSDWLTPIIETGAATVPEPRVRAPGEPTCAPGRRARRCGSVIRPLSMKREPLQRFARRIVG